MTLHVVRKHQPRESVHPKSCKLLEVDGMTTFESFFPQRYDQKPFPLKRFVTVKKGDWNGLFRKELSLYIIQS